MRPVTVLSIVARNPNFIELQRDSMRRIAGEVRFVVINNDHEGRTGDAISAECRRLGVECREAPPPMNVNPSWAHAWGLNWAWPQFASGLVMLVDMDTLPARPVDIEKTLDGQVMRGILHSKPPRLYPWPGCLMIDCDRLPDKRLDFGLVEGQCDTGGLVSDYLKCHGLTCSSMTQLAGGLERDFLRLGPQTPYRGEFGFEVLDHCWLHYFGGSDWRHLGPDFHAAKRAVFDRVARDGCWLEPETFAEVVTSELSEGAVLNTDFQGFEEDYLVLHSLMRKYRPHTILEIGTHRGKGTLIICNATPGSRVLTLDLPPQLAGRSRQHPTHAREGVGILCDRPHEQFFGDSMEVDFESLGRIDGWYIDGEHDFEHVARESAAAIACGARLVVWHDSDMQPVMDGIVSVFGQRTDYRLVRVEGTRITYALKREEYHCST